MNSRLHHFAYNIRPNSLESVLEIFEKLECTLSYKEKGARWCMIKQRPIPIDIQIIETTDQPTKIDNKINTHIAFLSNNPKKVIEKIEKWSEDKNIRFRQGKWSDKELWFDLPDIFINFVIEVMHKSVVE